ncbi:hypothetical protein ACUL41_02360 [Virgibacillus natechei]|uniref:hypothetical protein n=1 Tax=Virgibacillus sp. CBA3643 TaxID=2942278 RepID=UPI0035A303DA
MQKILGFIAIFILLAGFIGTNHVLAAEHNEENKVGENEASELFSSFMDKVFNDEDKLIVLDSSGSDITNEFIDTTDEYYKSGDYQKIQSIIKDKNLSISYGEKSYMDNAEVKEYMNEAEVNENMSDDNDLNAVIGIDDSREFYHIATDTSGRFTKEWTVTLSGSYLYNTITKQSYSLTGPVVDLTVANFGASFSPYLSNISTSNSTDPLATFTANYTMEADLSIPIGDIPVGVTFDFGDYTDTLTSVP